MKRRASEFILRFFVRDETLILGAQINVRRENEKSFDPPDINTKFNDRRYLARRKVRNIIAIWPREDESLLAGTLLNPRSANASTIARSRALIHSTIFMPMLVQGEHIGGFNAT